MPHPEEEARTLRDQGEFDKALQVCDWALSNHPPNPILTALRRDIFGRRRQAVAELSRGLATQLTSERNLEKRLEIVQLALHRFPNERYFKQTYTETKRALDEILALEEKFLRMADEGRYEEAESILDTISGIYPEYPSLNTERNRLKVLQELAKLARKKARRVIGIRKVLAQQDIEGTQLELQNALMEFPNDSEILEFQSQLTELKQKSREAGDLYEQGRLQVAAEEYDAGIAMLRQANRLDPNSRRIEMALFNALVQFAKNIVEYEPKRAKYLLDEAARLSPLNLALESAAKFLYDRTQEAALNDCRMRAEILRDKGQTIDALKLVNELANKYQLHDDPAIEEIRAAILIDVGSEWRSHEEAGVEERIDLMRGQTSVAILPRIETDYAIGKPVVFQKASATLLQTVRQSVTGLGTWKVGERSRRTLERATREGQAMRAKTREWHDLSRSAYVRLPKAYKIGIGIASLLIIVATTVMNTSQAQPTKLTPVGTATMLSSVALFREPSGSSRVSGNLIAGQTVEIMTHLPAMALDAWTLVHPVGDKQITGYTRLQNLDRIRTGNPNFDLWHAMTFLSRTSKPDELRLRIANIDDLLQTELMQPSGNADALLLKLSKAFTGLAIGSQDDPDNARRLLVKAEATLSLVTGSLQLSSEVYELKESIHNTHIAFGDAAGEPNLTNPSARSRDDEARVSGLESSRRP